MKRAIVVGILAAVLAAFPVASAFATSTGNQGQPNQDCEAIFNGGQVTPPGFNTDGFNHASTVYAGSQPQNSNNPKSVSQYDVACFQTSTNHGK